MTKRLGVVMDPIEHIEYKKDTTLAMLLAAKERGFQLHYMRQGDLFAHKGQAHALLYPLNVYDHPERWYTLGNAQQTPLHELDVILMRKDPPYNLEYIYTTYLLELAEARGTLVVNKPQSLRDANEKVFTTWFPECTPATLITRQTDLIRHFVQTHQKVILKPLHGMGGLDIFYVTPTHTNLNVIIETLTQRNSRFIMAQQFIPDILTTGDKRILLINGDPIPYGLARLPPKGDIRGNLAAGGTGVVSPLTERERWVCEQIRPTLQRKGLWFVGIDVIGGYLTEINVTSPTCVREIQAGSDIDIMSRFFDVLDTLTVVR